MTNIKIKDFMKTYNYKHPEDAAECLINMVMTGENINIEGQFTLSHLKNTFDIWWERDDFACSSSMDESLERLTAIIEYAVEE